ncbi:hypothetical protein AB7W88_20490 [Providencia vermicola]|uniref:Uncharacterized protein n=3 Tax=Providencia TaxID=586 RepID=A0AAX3S4B4_9GAMM|nr:MULTISPECIES: hypothetical protein [Providencia]ELR5121681.1 hypothetical protein [Providencia stuartii]ELR5141051.1 hypothetical protein [Providencia stuartii]ELX8378421.1 hypothetical protein [Providencia stuartii]EMD5257628.1 hypothetical protein [Providencia stuartii]MTB41714.1 hypothetical protein [Providencia sp. wls1949]
MSTEILFPIKKLPQFEDILNSIIDGFNDFSLSTKQLTIGISAKKGVNLVDKFIYIHDHQYDYFCWVSFNFIEENLRDIEDIEYPYMGSVSTRGEANLKFSALILYIISSSLNSRIIYDDAYLIQTKESYPSCELKLFVERYIQDLYSIT